MTDVRGPTDSKFDSPNDAIERFACGGISEDQLVEILGTWPTVRSAALSRDEPSFQSRLIQDVLEAYADHLIDIGLYVSISERIHRHLGD